MRRLFSFILIGMLLAGCGGTQIIVSHLDERDANEIVVFLASKGIVAQKEEVQVTGAGATGSTALQFNISVDKTRATEAMAVMGRYGLPRRQGTTLLELFQKSGLMSSDREETIRYQAGLAEQLRNTIRKIDGVLDADVQISFPPTELAPGAGAPKVTAAVYVKHQGILEDPNSFIDTKIKRLMAGSVSGLEFENVAVVSDRSRFADLSIDPSSERIGDGALPPTYVRVGSIVMTRSSLASFRALLFSLIGIILLFAAALGWLLYKFYPQLLKKGSGG